MSKRSPLAVTLGLALLLTLGLGVAWALVVAWCGHMADDCLRRHNEYRYVQVLLDGTPVVISYSRTDYAGQTVRGLDGKEVPPEDRIGRLTTSHLWGLRKYFGTPRILPWHQRLTQLSDQNDPPVIWTFVHSGDWEGSGYFAGYDWKSKLCIGYLGTAGFRDDLPPPEERFEMDGRALACQRAVSGAFSQYGQIEFTYAFPNRPGARLAPWAGFMVSGDRILRFDLRTGKTEKIMDVPGAFGFVMATRASPLDVERKRPAFGTTRLIYLMLRTADHLVIVDADGHELERYVIPESVRAEGAEFYLLDNRTVLADVRRQREGNEVSDLLWFNSFGQIVRREEVVLSESTLFNKPAAEKWWAISACVPAPIVVAGAVVVKALDDGPDADLAAAAKHAWLEMWSALLAVSLVAAVLAGICYRRQRRYALPWTAIWVAFVFLTGVPGLLGYLFHRRWPVLDACPACSRSAPRDREACAHCHTEFPAPTPKGIEVFA